ncbi:thioredoxin family protein [Paenibacillus allorhizosphaerae]|nr:thioredoxin family protein [Paenibacillus allorhizosphaerae]
MLLLDDNTFRDGIRKQGVTLIDFGSVHCPPCRVLLPILEELEATMGDRMSIAKIDCDDSPRTASDYGVMSMPTVILFHDGEPVEKLVGLRPKSVYESVIAKYLTNE